MKTRSLLLATLLLPAVMSACAPAQDNAVSDARVRLPAAEGRPGAAYFTLHGGDKGLKVVKIDSPEAGRAEMHDMIMQNGMMTMAALPAGVAVPAKSEVQFAPGGKHVMLFDMKAGLKAGDTIMLNFSFADGSRLGVPATAEAPGGGDAHSH